MGQLEAKIDREFSEVLPDDVGAPPHGQYCCILANLNIIVFAYGKQADTLYPEVIIDFYLVYGTSLG
ncbi:hypothetical protein Btru_068115 [Bulinus truncatus]|nr:hypothetical protein Btru_068115 [Bulinus truncatus]